MGAREKSKKSRTKKKQVNRLLRDNGFFKKPKPYGECPICGRTRRAGYFVACLRCGWIVEIRRELDSAFSGMLDCMRGEGIGMSWTHSDVFTEVKLQANIPCTSVDAISGNGKQQTRTFGVSRMISYTELSRSEGGARKCALHDVASMLRMLRDEISHEVDCNGVRYEVCGASVPIAGNWGSFRRTK